MYCSNFKGLLKAYDSDAKKRLLAVARCKMWSCEYCANKNRAKWRAIILDFINKSKKAWSWFTITAHKNTHKHGNITRSTYVNLRGVFSKLMKRIRRKFKGDIPYVRIFEQHKSGALHIHCIIGIQFDDIVIRNKGKKNQYNDSKWLRKVVPKLGGGFMTHADNLSARNSHFAAAYVCKYMTKTSDNEAENLKGIRRIQSSRHMKFSGQTGDSELEFTLSTGYWIDEYENDIDQGIIPYSITEKKRITFDDYEGTTVYPK